jgi:hypothetical protein
MVPFRTFSFVGFLADLQYLQLQLQLKIPYILNVTSLHSDDAFDLLTIISASFS